MGKKLEKTTKLEEVSRNNNSPQYGNGLKSLKWIL
jgi:hypothetical protein